MKHTFYLLILCICIFCVVTPPALAMTPVGVKNPHIIVNTPRTSPYADHPDLWKGRTLLQVEPQTMTQQESPLAPVAPDNEHLKLGRPENWYPQGDTYTDDDALWQKGASLEDVNSIEKHRIDGSIQSNMLHMTNTKNSSTAHTGQAAQGTRTHNMTQGNMKEEGEVAIQAALLDAFEQSSGLSLNTRPSIARQLEALDAYHQDNLNKRKANKPAPPVAGRSLDLDTQWRTSITEPIKIDEDILTSKRNVVGAYANLQGDGLQVFVGPEFHLPEGSPLQTTPRTLDDSEVGMGMQVLWDF